jgi:hypothetical protein
MRKARPGPKRGFKQTDEHRQRIAESMRTRARYVQMALQKFKPPVHVRVKGAKKPQERENPPPTPVPPSAGPIAHNALLQRWAVYSFHDSGHYYFKREHADTLEELHHLIVEQEIALPLWTYVKSAATPEDLFMPLRIPESALPGLGHRWHKYVRPTKAKRGA